MSSGREERPAANRALSNVTVGDITILPPTTLHHPKAVLPAYAVFVMRQDQRWRRQLYLSLHAAQKAMDRAEANGIEARCQLVEIVPVPAAPMIVVGEMVRMSTTTKLARALLDAKSVTNVQELTNHEPSWWLHTRLAQIDRAAINSRLNRCAHVGPTSLGVIALWDSGNLWCLWCASTALRLEGVENNTCDRCAAYADPIEVCTVAGRHAVVVFGLCTPCSEREVGR